MSQHPEEPLAAYVYRRVAPPDYKIKRNWVNPSAFTIQPWMKGLSVYRADIAKPVDVLQARLEEAKAQLGSEDESKSERARRFLANNPDVRALVEQSQYRVVIIPLAAITAMGFDGIEEPDASGHLNVLGTAEEFDAHKMEFIELIDSGQARILSLEECLEEPGQV